MLTTTDVDNQWLEMTRNDLKLVKKKKWVQKKKLTETQTDWRMDEPTDSQSKATRMRLKIDSMLKNVIH